MVRNCIYGLENLAMLCKCHQRSMGYQEVNHQVTVGHFAILRSLGLSVLAAAALGGADDVNENYHWIYGS
jgi:hypothetical protein